jgi:hypothetical protein
VRHSVVEFGLINLWGLLPRLAIVSMNTGFEIENITICRNVPNGDECSGTVRFR